MLPSRVTHLILDLRLPPEKAGKRLASGMDHVRSLLFSMTWGLRGAFVGNVRGDEVQMRVRHGYSNGYTRLMFGRIEPAPSGGGSRLRVEFHDVRFVVLLMNVVTLLILGPGLWYWLRNGAPEALIVPAAVVGILLVVEIIGRKLGRRDEEAMRRHLAASFQDVMAAGPRL